MAQYYFNRTEFLSSLSEKSNVMARKLPKLENIFHKISKIDLCIEATQMN